MTKEKAHEFIETARVFAHTFHTHKKFAGYNEDEIAKGVAAVYIVMNESRNAKEESRPKMTLEEMDEFIRSLGLFIGEDNRILEVYEIVADTMSTMIEVNSDATA